MTTIKTEDEESLHYVALCDR